MGQIREIWYFGLTNHEEPVISLLLILLAICNIKETLFTGVETSVLILMVIGPSKLLEEVARDCFVSIYEH